VKLAAPSAVKGAPAAWLEQAIPAANSVKELALAARSAKERLQRGQKRKTHAHSVQQNMPQAQKELAKISDKWCFERSVPRRAAYQISQVVRTEPMRSAAQLQRWLILSVAVLFTLNLEELPL
jgi:hypothetical protein